MGHVLNVFHCMFTNNGKLNGLWWFLFAIQGSCASSTPHVRWIACVRRLRSWWGSMCSSVCEMVAHATLGSNTLHGSLCYPQMLLRWPGRKLFVHVSCLLWNCMLLNKNAKPSLVLVPLQVWTRSYDLGFCVYIVLIVSSSVINLIGMAAAGKCDKFHALHK